MPAITFTVPILKGQSDHWKKALGEMKGARAADHSASRKRAGFSRELVCLQATPMGDYVVVMLEGADPLGSLKKMVESRDPFDQWFGKTVMGESHGMKPGQPLPVPQVMLDWRG